ncbi:MAG: MaoC family dehydratase [Dehalococcoidia bacterium]
MKVRDNGGKQWDSVRIGDTAPPYVYQVTAEKIVQYCRAARYENLVYSNQPAARETGLPGIIAPPAMVFVYAPTRIEALLGFSESNAEGKSGASGPLLSPVKIQMQFQGTLVTPEEIITSVTKVQDKLAQGDDRFLVLQVVAHNQRGELVAEYSSTYSWEESG